jgi:hypothetical protein
LHIRKWDKYIGPARRLIKFASTVAKRPDLGRAVRVIDVYIMGTEMEYNWIPEDIMAHAEILQSLPGMRAEYFKPMTPITVFPHVYMLLALTPNVQKVIIEADGGDQGISKLVQLLPNYLQRLTVLTILSHNYVKEENKLVHITDLAPFMSLPQLREFSIGKAKTTPSPTYPHQFHYPPFSLTLTHLTLRECVVSDSCIEAMLASVKSLKQFRFDMWNDTNRKSNADIDLDPQRWHSALAKHSATLQDLDMNFRDRNVFLEEFPGLPQNIVCWQSFSDFPALKRLSLEYHRLESPSHLPPSLVSLTLTDCRDVEDYEEIEEWSSIDSTVCPGIKNIVVYASHVNEELLDTLEEAGFEGRDIRKKTVFSGKRLEKKFGVES